MLCLCMPSELGTLGVAAPETAGYALVELSAAFSLEYEEFNLGVLTDEAVADKMSPVLRGPRADPKSPLLFKPAAD